MRIAFISLYNTTPWGGSEDLWVKTAIYAKNQGHDILASVCDFGEFNSPKILILKEHGITLHFRNRNAGAIPLHKRFFNKLGHKFFKINNQVRVIKAFKPEVIFINDPGTFTLIHSYLDTIVYIQKLKIPYFIVCKLTPDYGSMPDPHILEKATSVFNNAKKMLFVSKRMLKNVERFLATEIKNGIVIQNPLNISELSYIDWPSGDEINMACVAHLGPSHKGQHILLDILAGETWKIRNWKLNFYGEGKWKEYLIRLAKFYNIENKVTFNGYVNDIRDIWKNNHILVLPTFTEGMPKALLEAMVCGRPSVVTDIGGIGEVITDSSTGFIAEAPSINSFGKKLDYAWNKQKEWKKIGLNAHNFITDWLDKNPEKTLFEIIVDEKYD